MITLKTLPEATAQEVFEQGARHLLTQAKKAIDVFDSFTYRSPDGARCPGGSFISDEEYNVDFEGQSWCTLAIKGKVPTHHHVLLIQEMQDIHDDESQSPEQWKDMLKFLGQQHNLNTDFLSEF